MADFDWNNYLEVNKTIAVPEELFSHVSFNIISCMLYNIFFMIDLLWRYLII